VLKVPALPIGPVFGLGILSLAALACSGSAFKGEGSPDVDPKHSETTDPVVPNHGGAATAVPSTPATDGGAAEVEPQPLAGNTHTGGGGAGGSHAGGGGAGGGGGSAGSLVMAGTGGVVQLPDQGTAGEPNIPDPPVDPSCAAPLAENWTHAIGTTGSNWEVQFGDPSIDVANHRLVVTYDDVAARTTAFDGGYYVAADVTLEGGTVLTPYPYSNEMRWPSLRRGSTGSTVQLGGAKYGSNELWTTNDWPGFSGTTIDGTTTATVTTYVKAVTKALAVKVTAGAHTYRSGWVSGFTWPQTNLGIMRYVGENNSNVHAGDAVYVGPLRGCQKLSDAAVDALFQN
jgi:hypothetical protein